MPKTLLLPKLGEILQTADLVTTAQIEVALQNQQYYQLRLGEILALHGWLEQETVDFFAEIWPQLLMEGQAHPLGYYLKQAKLLSAEQVQMILKEQKQLGIRFGAVAVLKGWLKEKTLAFFLENLSPQTKSESDFQGKDGGEEHFIEDQETGFIKKRSEILHIGESSITLPDEPFLKGIRSPLTMNRSASNAERTDQPLQPIIQVPKSKPSCSDNFSPLSKLDDGESFDLASVLELDMEDFGLTASTDGNITW
jgi:hypothetical protein